MPHLKKIQFQASVATIANSLTMNFMADFFLLENRGPSTALMLRQGKQFLLKSVLIEDRSTKNFGVHFLDINFKKNMVSRNFGKLAPVRNYTIARTILFESFRLNDSNAFMEYHTLSSLLIQVLGL